MILSDSNESGSDDHILESGNPALADAMRKVLNIGKNTNNASMILAKAKVSDTPLSKFTIKKDSFEIIKNNEHDNKECINDTKDNSEDIKDIKPKALIRRLKKQEVAAQGRMKPSPLDRERERPLSKIATRGVVQLFNAVREQQKIISKKMEEAGASETRKEKALKSVSRKSFLDVLRGCADALKTKATPLAEDPVKTEDESDGDEGGKTEPGWSVLRDDFMMGAKLKDWNKKEEEAASGAPPPAKRSKR